MLFTALLLAASPAQQIRTPIVPSAPAERIASNIVLVLADDIGVDQLAAYGEAPNPPCTPNIDAFANGGMLFRNAWAAPTCTPTRASILTGRYGFRTGIGQPGANSRLPLSETTIPEILPGFTSACVGKWHLAGGNGGSPTHPNDTGFDYYAGSLGGAVPDYSMWQRTENGTTSVTTTYATTATVDDAIAAMHSMPEPWILYVSFNAPHTPYHVPPASVCQTTGCPVAWCDSLPPNPSNIEMAKAMVEGMDAEFGRFMGELNAVSQNSFVFFMGDNGTARQVVEPPFIRQRAKGTVYEGGVNVPLIVRGPGVRPEECAGLVSCVDLFATFAELTGSTATSEDSVSLVPYFRNPTQSVRRSVYSESFSPNGGSLPFASHARTVRSARYKLIRETGQADEFYDLELDPFESTNLLPGLTAAQQAEYDGLIAELVALGVD